MAILMDPKKDIPPSERDIRLEDWLNDKIQSSADFSKLGSLMEKVDIQKKQLEQQVLLHSCQNLSMFTSTASRFSGKA
jgi:hypothetical protein